MRSFLPFVRSRGRDPERILRELGLPHRFTLEDLVEATQRRRNRPLRLKEHVLPPECSALWVHTRKGDCIVVDERLSPLQATQAITHELCHMLLEHRPRAATSMEELRQALEIPERMQVLARSALHYDDSEEQEAEALAVAICARLHYTRCADSGRSDDPTAARFIEHLG